MSTATKNRFIKEVKDAARGNPNIDMKLIREWQKVEEILENIPPSPKPKAPKPAHLQPIPLQMFRR